MFCVLRLGLVVVDWWFRLNFLNLGPNLKHSVIVSIMKVTFACLYDFFKLKLTQNLYVRTFLNKLMYPKLPDPP